jgi:hypothetical protein
MKAPKFPKVDDPQIQIAKHRQATDALAAARQRAAEAQAEATNGPFKRPIRKSGKGRP